MEEPLLWNPLPQAAAWLATRTGRPMDARALVDLVVGMGEEGDPKPTIIKALLPRNLEFATLAMTLHPALHGSATDVGRIFRDGLEKKFGPLPIGMAYIKSSSPTVTRLCVNHLVELLLYAQVKLMVLLRTEAENPHEMVWIMPWGASHDATIETCGINRADLLALAENLTEAKPQDEPIERSKQAATKGITKNQALIAFESLVQIDLKSAMEDKPKWIVDACTDKGRPGKRHRSTWDPVILGIAILEKFKIPKAKINRAFYEHPFLKDWREDWSEKSDN